MYENPDFMLVEFPAPKQVKTIDGEKFVAYGYTHKHTIAEEKATSIRTLGHAARISEDGKNFYVVWISKGRILNRPGQGHGLNVKRFKVKKQGDYYRVNGGKIAGKYYRAVEVMSQVRAIEIADARNRLVAKKAGLTRRIRAGRKQA